MRDKKLRFSVVIPCYNEEAYISSALKSLNAQKYDGNYEVIVVDNNCSDNTAVIAERLGAKVVREPSPGVCWARHSGTEAAKGEIVISTDADNVFDDDWLTKIDIEFLKNPSLVAVGGPCSYIGGPWWGRAYPKIMFGFIYVLYKLTSYTMYVTATNIAFKKSAWAGYNTTLTQGGDEFDLLHRLRQKGRVAFVRQPVVHTSSRRLLNGLLYTIFVSFLYYYLSAYFINKLFDRRIIDLAPVLRTEKAKKISYISLSITFILIMFGIGIGTLDKQAYTSASRVIDTVQDHLI